MSELPPDITSILAFNETGAQFFKRVQQERILTGFPILDNNLSLRPGIVLEVAGPSGSGKTELLLSIALHVLLSPYADPNSWKAPQAHPPLPPHQPQQQELPAGAPCNAGEPQQPHPNSKSSRSTAATSTSSGPPSSGSVVIFDLDGKFDGVRLMQVLEPQVQSAWRDQQQQRLAARSRPRAGGTGNGGDGSSTAVSGGGGGTGPRPPEEPLLSPDQVVEEVLSRLHLVRCRSSLQLLEALAGLPRRLGQLQAAGAPCLLLLVDNVGAHYWQDRAAKQVTGSGLAGASYSATSSHHQQQQQQAPLSLSLFELHAAIAARLAHVSRRHRLPVVATKTAAVTAKGVEGGGSELGAAPLGGGGEVVQLQQREFMPMPWQNVVTHRLLLYPRGVVTPAPRGTQQQQPYAQQCLTAILVEMLGAVGQGAAAPAGPVAAPSAQSAATSTAGAPGFAASDGRGLAQLLVSSVAMVEGW